MSKKRKIAVGACGVVVLGLFMLGYNYASNKLNTPKKNQDKGVYNDGEKVLKDELVISLYNNNEIEKTLTVESFKENYGIEKALTEENLKDVLKEQGYEIDRKNDNIFTFKKNTKKQEKDNYCIGEDNGYFAIFKADEKGNISVIAKYETLVDNIPLSDKERKQIKDKEFFSSKNLDEVEREMSKFTT